MMDETENLVPEPLRGIGQQLESWRSVFFATTGSLDTDMKDHDPRLAKLEGTHA